MYSIEGKMYEVHIALVYGVYVSLGSLVPVQKMNIYLFLVVNTIQYIFSLHMCFTHPKKRSPRAAEGKYFIFFYLFCDIFSSYYSFNIFSC